MRLVFQQILLGVLSMVLLDYVWLTKIMGPLFRQHMGHLLRNDVLSTPAVLTWIIMTLLLLVFVVHNQTVTSVWTSFLYGALLGAGMYAVYDLTNFATLRGRHLPTALLDIAWGALLGGVVSAIMYSWGS